MGPDLILRLGARKDVHQFQRHVKSRELTIPCDDKILTGSESPPRTPIQRGVLKIGNRIAVQPMEGWDGTSDGNPTEPTLRRWRHFGRSGGKLIWGGERLR